MSTLPRKVSPRAPSMSLGEAVERAGKAYDKERLHAAPADVVAQNIGYRGASNGAALAALASLRYYGLLERPKDGVLVVAKDYENYRFAPNETTKRGLLRKFLLSPPLFRELLDQYADGFPSDATLQYELIQRGFLPATAANLVNVLRRSIEFAGEPPPPPPQPAPGSAAVSETPKASFPGESVSLGEPDGAALQATEARAPAEPAEPLRIDGATTHDRIPVRLSGNRRAWLVVPEPFYEADKKRLKAQIDLLLTEDENAAD